MAVEQDAKELISGFCHEVALLVGSLITEYDVEEELVWELCRNLDSLRLRYLGKLETQAQAGPVPHPAVQELLRKIREC